MKRYLVIMVSFIVILLAGYYLYYVEGFYVDLKKETTISTPFYIDDGVFYQQQTNGDKEFVIRGVEVDSSYGPKRGTDFAIDEETYMRWFEMIQQMGANTIRISTIFDDQFYNAFYKYNKDRKEPLFLLQGIRVATDEFEAKHRKEDLQFYQTLLKDGRNIVDIIHGRKVILTNDHKGSGFYLHDISPWVIGFLIGDEWDQDTLSYIDLTLKKERVFNGEYVTTVEEATNFEVMMAEVINDIVSYESKKYNTQRPISVNSTFLMDPFQYEKHYAAQLGKVNTFMIDHIQPTPKMHSGLFASYAYEKLEYPLHTMFEHEEIFADSNVNHYLRILNEAHKVPVVISSIGYPSSSYLNHKEKQEIKLIDDIKNLDAIGYDGVVIRSWTDVWDRRTFETSYAVDLQQIHEWHDPLTSTQHFGIIGFKPYRDQVLMQIDGKKEDWEDVKNHSSNETTKVWMTRDHTYLYLWIEDSVISKAQTFYLAFDLHPNLGSNQPQFVDITFDRRKEFLIQVQPFVGARMYVQDRYQSVRQSFLELVNGRNPFLYFPDEDSNTFERMQYVKKDKKILTEEEMTLTKTKSFHYIYQDIKPLKIFNHNDLEEADVAIEDGYMEIRLPYQLLNIYDPLKFTIHDDYYKHYGVEPLEIKEFYISVGNNKRPEAKSVKIIVEPLKSLKRVEEYVKPSYDMVKNYWKGEG